jgi:hypothetical protein
MAAALVLLMIPGCKKSTEEAPEEFPDCVGIEESFNPYSIRKAYNGRIWSQDTSFTTQFIFTDYKFDASILRTSWMMYFKRNTSPTRVVYQSAWCFRSDITNYWFASTGFDFEGLYNSWDFYFEEFDCTVLSGHITVIRPDIPETLDFYFEGSR